MSQKSVKKFTPLTKCDKIPVTLCGPAGCGFKPGVEECHDEVQTVVGDNPEETCSLDPQTTCKHVTKLVPALKEVENCFDVPKEVCVREEVNPRKVAVPVVKKWCYVVSCPEPCLEAARRGECPLECEEHRGNGRCCAPCSLECQEAARSVLSCLYCNCLIETIVLPVVRSRWPSVPSTAVTPSVSTFLHWSPSSQSLPARTCPSVRRLRSRASVSMNAGRGEIPRDWMEFYYIIIKYFPFISFY